MIAWRGRQSRTIRGGHLSRAVHQIGSGVSPEARLGLARLARPRQQLEAILDRNAQSLFRLVPKPPVSR